MRARLSARSILLLQGAGNEEYCLGEMCQGNLALYDLRHGKNQQDRC